MADPFAMALGVLFSAPGSLAAVYQPADGDAKPIRVIRSQPDETSALGPGRVIQASNTFDVRRSDVAKPQRGDRIIIDPAEYDPGTFEVLSEPMLDLEGLTWTCGAEPVQ